MRAKLLTITLFSTQFLAAQYTDNLHVNYIDAKFSANGLLFMDPTEYTGDYHVPGHVPDTENSNTIYAAGIWLGGVDGDNVMHVASSAYHQMGDDFWPGPISNDYASEGYHTKYDNVWKVDRATIDGHIADWNTPGYIVPEPIASWPGNGYIPAGEAAILAPFYDYNNNMIYDPENGDYPLIRGDQAVFMIVNDAADLHTESGGLALGVEMQLMAYGFDAPTDSALNQTVFLNAKVINRSANDYHDFFLGTFSDFDIGSYEDDYVGCDSSLNLFFGYNSDATDGPDFGNYGIYPPAQGIVYLNRPMHMYKYYTNDFTVTGNPFVAEDYYNYLQGKWKDGTPQTEGGTGYGGLEPNNFMFSGHPMDPDGWSEITSVNSPGDRRGLASVRPITFNAGDTVCIDMAFVSAFAFDTVFAAGTATTNHALGATEILKQRAIDIQNFYDATFDACTKPYEENPDFELGVEQEELLGITVSPNPAVEGIMIQLKNGGNAKAVNIYNEQGSMVKSVLTVNNSTYCDISNLPAGIYHIVVTDDHAIEGHQTFIKE